MLVLGGWIDPLRNLGPIGSDANHFWGEVLEHVDVVGAPRRHRKSVLVEHPAHQVFPVVHGALGLDHRDQVDPTLRILIDQHGFGSADRHLCGHGRRV